MTIKEIFETMDYGPAPESDKEAMAWLADRGDFGLFIGGNWTEPGTLFDTVNPATGDTLARVTQATSDDIAAAVKAARDAQPGWARDHGRRARVLYALARLLQKHARMFAVLESLDSGKPIRESRDIDVPLAQRHFYHHAGYAQLMPTEMPDRAPLGVCGQVIPWNFPLLMLAWKIAPALAMGNTVVLKPAEWTPLTAMLFAQICGEAGVPPGVVNIVTGDGEVGEMIVGAKVDKIAFTGSTAVGRRIREATAGTGKALSLELGGKGPYIVFEDADIDSAVEGLVDAIWFNGGQVCCAGSRLLVQDGIAEVFHAKLRARMAQLRIGDPLDKCIDVGAIVHPEQLAHVRALVEANTDGTIFQTEAPEGCYYPPTLISDLDPASPLMQQEIFGPVLVSTTFRTPEEAVEIANNSRYGLAASVWSEDVNLALDVAPKLEAGIVWVNGTNMMDAAAPFGGIRESGFGREGGWEGLGGYTRAATRHSSPAAITPQEGTGTGDGIDRTSKLYIGGKQARPDGGYSRAVHGPEGALLGHASLANRKDLRNAVEAMNAARGWGGSSGHLRAQILYFIAENLSARAHEFASRLKDLTGKDGTEEVAAAVDRLFSAAAWADKYDGQVKGVPVRGVALAMKAPVGKIGILCPDAAPLLGLVSLMAPAIAMGNRVTLVASEAYPLVATDFFQVLDTSDVPGGVVNILTGAHADLAEPMARHLDLDAVWGLSGHAQLIEAASAQNLKRTWVGPFDPQVDTTKDLLAHATEVKTIWVPYGA
ncbi:aldehyde dehydrogenase family protein [Salipiger sp. IMCC34102]|uniref:aldehyde dehydrogenase family protein n=1 Tax=Salipiger sp. IMCC34102 TaxID=2510647 RepID=UPI00101D05E7|nr:aldehyde dehydrogenase family protein [Salipiger sp. IMCC34102]RYH03950.1 aldehyde dehydrogenase family protein [Salipiger sp. IMCC34102]